MDEVATAFSEAADTFAGLLELPEVAARWYEPSTMEGFVVGAVVGHVNAAIAPLEWALDKPAPSDVKVIRLGRYYTGMKVPLPRRVTAKSAWRARKAIAFWTCARSSRSRSGWTTFSGRGSWSWSSMPTISPPASAWL